MLETFDEHCQLLLGKFDPEYLQLADESVGGHRVGFELVVHVQTLALEDLEHLHQQTPLLFTQLHPPHGQVGDVLTQLLHLQRVVLQLLVHLQVVHVLAEAHLVHLRVALALVLDECF